VLGCVSANDEVDLRAKLGIALLLFVVGLKLDLHIIRTMGPVALATGLGQVLFIYVVGYFITIALGMTPVTALGEAGDAASLGREAIEVLVKGGSFIAAIGLLMRYVLTPLLHQLARSPELLVLFAIAWAVALGAAGVHLGFSKEVGAFLAGVLPYREAIGARLVSLRDFLLLCFFIDLGAGLELHHHQRLRLHDPVL